jgi:hypothetical protein
LPRLDKKPIRNSDASDLSFYCIGETEATKPADLPAKEIQVLKKRQAQNSARVSGEGTDPWTQAPPAACRLCRKPGVRGIRGLCNDCETDFIRPKTRRFEFSSSDEDEIKPTPPLKDLEFLRQNNAKKVKEVGAQRKSVPHPNQTRTESGKQRSVKAELKMTGTQTNTPRSSTRSRDRSPMKPFSMAKVTKRNTEVGRRRK